MATSRSFSYFEIFFEDSARKWFNCSTLSAQLEDSPEVLGVAQDTVEILDVVKCKIIHIGLQF